MPISHSPIAGRKRTTTGKTLLPSSNAAKSLADHARTTAPLLGCGVIVVLACNLSLLPYARAAIERRALEGRNIADRVIPSCNTLTSLYGGSASHELAMASILAQADNHAPDVAKRHRFESVGAAREIDCLSNEGIHILLSMVDRGSCVTAAQSLKRKPQEDVSEALLRLETEAKEKQVAVILFLHCPRGDSETWLRDYCGEVLVVDEYDPEPDASLGFSVTAMSLEHSHSLGVGRTACDITLTASRIRCRWGVFIAPTVEERAAYYLRKEDLSLREIGEIFGIDDHTKVWRWLKKVPKNLDVAPPDGWREKYFVYLGLDLDESDTSDAEADVDAEAGAEGDLSEWDDDEPPLPVKRRPRIC